MLSKTEIAFEGVIVKLNADGSGAIVRCHRPLEAETIVITSKLIPQGRLKAYAVNRRVSGKARPMEAARTFEATSIRLEEDEE